MPTASQVMSSARSRQSIWLERRQKIILTSLTGIGLLWAVSCAFDLVFRTKFCRPFSEAGGYARMANRWRTAKQSINLKKLKNTALTVRTGECDGAPRWPDHTNLDCEVVDANLGGSYNFFFKINFSDGKTWLARVAGYAGQWEDREIQKHDQDHQTLDLLRRNTTLPVPQVFFWESTTELIGRSFALLSNLPGERLFDKWFDDTWVTEEKRLNILTQIAEFMAQLGKLRFKEVGGILFDPSEDFPKIGPTYEYRKMRGESPEIFSYGPWRTYQHYQREKEGRMSHEIDVPGKLHRRVILMASRSIPGFMYGDGTYLAHPDYNLQNILVDDEGNVTGIIDWDDTWTRSRSTGYASFPMWLTQDWDPANYAYNVWSDPSLDALRPFQSQSEDLRRWRKHYSTIFLSKWTEHFEDGNWDTREHTHSHIMQAIDYALLCKASCLEIVVKLLDHAFRGVMPFDIERFAGDSYDKQEEADILVKIGQAFDEMWLCEPA